MKKIETIENRINEIKKELLNIGRFRSGSLTKQYKNPKDKAGEYYQLSYTHKMKSKTEYIKKSNVDKVKKQIEEYKKFKSLISELVELEKEYCKVS